MPRQLLPEEQQMQALDQQIQARYGGLQSLESGGDRNAIASQFGANSTSDSDIYRRGFGQAAGDAYDLFQRYQTNPNSITQPELQRLQTGLGATMGGAGQAGYYSQQVNNLRSQFGGPQDLTGQLRGQIEGLTKQQQSLREQAINSRLGMAQQAEQGALSGLEQRGKEYQSAIDEQLQRMLGQTEYQAGQARQAVGSNLAERGLLRSSFGDQTLGEVGAQEVGQKAQQRVQAAQEQGLAQQGVDKTKQQIARKREMLATNRDLSQLQAFEDVGFNLDVDNLNQGVQQQMNQMELDARQQNAFGQIIGGLFSGLGAIGGFALGGPAGAAAGGSLGKLFGGQ